MNNILITSAGQRVSLVKAFKKELQKIYGNAKVYTVDLDPALAPACQISDGYRAVPPVTDKEYIPKLLNFCKEFNVKLIVPTIDTELLVLAENRKTFLNYGITPVVSSEKLIAMCRDKRLLNDFFAENAISTPQTIDKENPSFPLFIKPYDGSLSKDIFLIENESQLTGYHLENPKFMFMEYIDHSKHDEYTVDTYYDKNGILKCIVPRKRIFVRAGEVNKGVTRKNEIVNYVKDKLSQIDGAIGCLTMQFFFNNQTKKIIAIEINPRFGGGYPLSYQAGANFPRYLIEEYMLDMEISFFEEWEENLLMLRYDDEIIVPNYE